MSDFDKTPDQDRIEDLLRRSLETRAQDVRPDPATWQKVSRRIRRGQVMRWSLAGAGAMGALLIAAVVVPNLLDRNRVDLDPSFGTRQASEVVETGRGGGGAAPCGGPQHVSAVLARNGEDIEGTIWALCDDGSETMLDNERPTGHHDLNPALSWDGQSLVFERVDDQGVSTLVHVDMTTGAEQTLMGGSLPAFASDGRIAWVQRVDQGQDRILVGRLFSEPELEFPVVDGEDGEWYEVARLAFDPSGETLYAEAGYVENQVFRYDIGSMYRSSSRGSVAPQRVQEPEPTVRYAGPGSGHQPGVVSVIARCCTAAEGDPFSRAELRVLSDGEVERTVELPSGFKVDDATYWTTWAPISALRTTENGVTIWSGGSRAGYLIGDGTGMWVVEPDGRSRLVAENVSSAAANPALTAGEPVQGGAPGSQYQTAPEQDGLTDEAVATRNRIWEATQARDFGALGELMSEYFTSSYGGSGGPEEGEAFLRQMEADGEDPFGLIQRLLVLRHAAQQTEGGPSPLYTWPAVFTKTADQWTEQDEAELRELGSAEDIAMWREHGSYMGWRLGIDAGGNWLYLVAGD